jgi:hypothetical protein
LDACPAVLCRRLISSPHFDTIGPFGKTVEDVACLLDVLIPEEGFRSSLSTVSAKLSIGVSSEHLSRITPEEESLFGQAQDCLSSIITAKDVRVPLHKRAGEADYANIMMDQGLKTAWDGYLKGVGGPMRSLQDVVDWHSQHPVSSRNWGFPSGSLLKPSPSLFIPITRDNHCWLKLCSLLHHLSWPKLKPWPLSSRPISKM